MYPVSNLYNCHPNSDIYVVGTGSSLRVFPPSFFDGKIVVGLNMAWKLVKVTYGITIHPDLNIPEFMHNELPHPDITWITKRGKAKALLTPKQFDYADQHFYYFEMDGQKNTQPPNQPSNSGRMLEWIYSSCGNYLYQWSSISQTGVNLAANLGARNIILVGCDNCSLLGNHHAHNQHTAWKGEDPQVRYHQYFEGLVEVRSALRTRGVNLVSMNPFLTLENPQRDFEVLCQELKQPKVIQNNDISTSIGFTNAIGKTIPTKKKSVFRSWFERLKSLFNFSQT